MFLKKPGGGKLTQLVANHIFGNKYRNKDLSIVDAEGMPDKVRGYSGLSGPCLNSFPRPTAVQIVDLFKKLPFNKRPFL